jgi:MSHA biogenesis protein MshK
MNKVANLISPGGIAAAVVSQALLSASLLSFSVCAADLPDPTRPPAAQRRASTGATAGGARASGAPVLQAVLTGVGRPSSAIIDGRLLQVGDRVGDLRVTRVSDGSAALTGPRGITTLALTPDAEKRVAGTAPSSRLSVTAVAPRKPSHAALSLQVADQK